MKVVMKPIEMIAWFKEEGAPKPLKYRITEKDGTQKVIKVDHITSFTKEKLTGNHMFVYTCQSNIKSKVWVYELKYELSTCKWYLSKI